MRSRFIGALIACAIAVTPVFADGEILHGTFDFSEEIGENIAGGVTLFGVNQQQPLQGYGAIQALTLQARYGISPASKVTTTGPAFLTKDNLATAPTRFIVDPDNELRFIAVQHARCAWDSFWCTVEAGIMQAAEDTGADVTILGPDSFDLNRVAELVDQAIAAQPDGILMTYTDGRFKDPVERALAAGIPVIAYNAGQGPEKDGVGYLTYLGQDEYLGGYEGGRRLVAAAGSGTHKAVCINQAVGHVGLDARCQGFADALAEAGIAMAGSTGVLGISDDAAASQQTISDFHAANPDIDIFLTLGPNGATPFLRLRGAGRSGRRGLRPRDVRLQRIDRVQHPFGQDRVRHRPTAVPAGLWGGDAALPQSPLPRGAADFRNADGPRLHHAGEPRRHPVQRR